MDLRNNCIGVEEWADMVHFVRHVGRPLEMVMARDKAFVAPMPPVGAATTSTTETTTGTSNGKMMIADDDVREETEEVKVEEDGGMEAEEVDAPDTSTTTGRSPSPRSEILAKPPPPISY